MNKFALSAAKALSTLGLGLTLAFSTVNAATSNDEIIERITPVGAVCVVGDDSCGGPVAAAPVAAAGAARSADDIYTTKCAACHATGVLGAPKVGTPDWQARLDEKGMETLLSHALNGFNAMPPRGTCADCSDDEIKSTIEHMIEASK